MPTKIHENRFPKTSDEVAEMVRQHNALFWWVARRIAPGGTPDTLTEIAAEVRLMAISSDTRLYDPSRGYKFNTFFLRHALNNARTVLKKLLHRGIHVPRHVHDAPIPIFAQLGSGSYDDGKCVPVPITHDSDAVDYSDIWPIAEKLLEPRDYKILRHFYIEYMSYRAIGRIYGITQERVRQVIQKSHRLLRERLRRYAEISANG